MVNVFRPVPDWGSWENQGDGVAVGSLAGDGTQDLVVLAVDNPAGQNQGRYRVGRTLDSSGQVTGGWGPWIEVPDWFSHENQGASIAVADLDGDGRQELIVAMVDNPGGQNRGLFRIGRQLDALGNVTGGWTPWREVPDWFSWENQGCGVAVADLDRDGGRDLIVFQIDIPVGQNQAFFRIGADLGDDGIPAGDWGLWLGMPNWFSWENQGGGIAVADLDNTWRLVAFMIDNPPQQNAGL